MPITWHPDGAQILMAVADDTVRVLDLDTDRVRTEPLAFLRGCRSGVVSGDGTRFFRGVAPTWHGLDARYAWLAR